MSCIYSSYFGQAFQWIRLLPWLVPLAISAASFGRDGRGRWGKQITLTLYAGYLMFVQLLLYILQASFNVEQSDPYCPQLKYWAFPSLEAFYTSSLTTYIVGFCFFWGITLSETYWVFLFVVLVAPPSVLVWFTYISWTNVLVSECLGIGTTLLFLCVLRYFILDELSYMLHTAPWTWMNAIDSYARTQEQMDYENKRIIPSLNRK